MTDAWRPISEAPKDGTRIIAWWKQARHPVIVWWNNGGYASFTTGKHDRFGIPDQYAPDWFEAWMPLPEPPPPPKGSIKYETWKDIPSVGYGDSTG